MATTRVRHRIARRATALVALALVVTAGLSVHAVVPGGSASDIAGDALYAAAAYAVAVVIRPRLTALAAGAIAAAWCVGIELLQLTGMPLAFGAVFPPVLLVLGTAFDARDLVVYVVTVGLLVAADAAIGAWRRRIRRSRVDEHEASAPL
ncbi:DUF2809 domain-containing protein [Microbacterium sp. BWT-B31]|uniref:DUF2809 domain-containing protein n=1 Tax=Microbacterium sp. BWT-B31 TaxID=3232072 RepID=UPI0035295AC5